MILDWVPAHFPTDAHGLGDFDGTHLFEHADPRRGFHPDWTSYIFNYGRHEVQVVPDLVGDLVARPLSTSTACASMASPRCCTATTRASPASGCPNEDGSQPRSRRDRASCRSFNRAVYARVPRRPDDRRGVDRVGRRVAPARARRPRLRLQVGPRLDARHARRTSSAIRSIAASPRRAHVPRDLREHRELRAAAVPRRGRARQGLADRQDARRRRGRSYANLRLLYGYQWTLPGKKLLFMGGELGVRGRVEPRRAARLGRSATHPAHAGVARWLGDLNACLPRATPRCTAATASRGGFEWLVADDRDNVGRCVSRHAARRQATIRRWSWRATSRRCRATATGSACRAPGYWREIAQLRRRASTAARVGQPRRRDRRRRAVARPAVVARAHLAAAGAS